MLLTCHFHGSFTCTGSYEIIMMLMMIIITILVIITIIITIIFIILIETCVWCFISFIYRQLIS